MPVWHGTPLHEEQDSALPSREIPRKCLVVAHYLDPCPGGSGAHDGGALDVSPALMMGFGDRVWTRLEVPVWIGSSVKLSPVSHLEAT